jgi:hypothetical protein
MLFVRHCLERRRFILFVDTDSVASSGRSIINVSPSAATIRASASRLAWSRSIA